MSYSCNIEDIVEELKDALHDVEGDLRRLKADMEKAETLEELHSAEMEFQKRMAFEKFSKCQRMHSSLKTVKSVHDDLQKLTEIQSPMITAIEKHIDEVTQPQSQPPKRRFDELKETFFRYVRKQDH